MLVAVTVLVGAVVGLSISIHNDLVAGISADPEYKAPAVLDGAIVRWEKAEWIDERLNDEPWERYYRRPWVRKLSGLIGELEE